MHYQTIRKLQRQNGYGQIQDLINSGLCWKMEGTVGRNAMDTLRSGATMLPVISCRDYYGSKIPSRLEVESGTTGSFKKCERFWKEFLDNGCITY